MGNEGNKRVVRLALFGDSQETAPGGGGRVYIPRLNHELFMHYSTEGGRVLAEVEMNALFDILKKHRTPHFHLHSKAKR